MVPVYRIINKLANKQRRVFENLSFPRKYSAAQGRFLHYLLTKEDTPVFQKELEEEFGVRPPSATSLLKSMEQNGLISREISEEDARRRHIHVCEKGGCYREELEENMAELEQRLVTGIDPDELAVWEKVSLQLLENLE